MNTQTEHTIYRLFRIGVFIKATVAVFELVVGTLALLISPSAISDFVIAVSTNALTDDPGDFIATHAITLAHEFSVTPQLFVAFYFLSRGIIKLILAVALLRGILWAYPAAIMVLLGFMIYQSYQLFVSYSFVILGITIFDILVLWLIWHEWNVVKKSKNLI
jgi:uncharacterized membrane protein